MQLSDPEFVRQFENQTLDPVDFNHIGHLRLCWLYLQQHDLETAVEKTSTNIQCYVENLGASDKFHRTITEFLVRLVYSRVTAQPVNSFDMFLTNNQDLVNDAQGILNQFYSTTLLNSASARLNYLPPDLIKLTS